MKNILLVICMLLMSCGTSQKEKEPEIAQFTSTVRIVGYVFEDTIKVNHVGRLWMDKDGDLRESGSSGIFAYHLKYWEELDTDTLWSR